MRIIDFKSCLIGILATSLVAVLLGAGSGQQPAPPPVAAQRYQISVADGSLYVYDNTTGLMNILKQSHYTPFPWVDRDQFSLNDALTKKEGGSVQAGPGHGS